MGMAIIAMVSWGKKDKSYQNQLVFLRLKI